MQSESLHTLCHQGPHKPSSCTTFMLKSLRGRAATGKKKKKKCCIYERRVASVVSNSLWPCKLCPARLLYRGSSRQGYWGILANTGCHTPLETIFPAALTANSPEYLVLPEPLRPKQLHLLHTWPAQGQTQVLQGSLRSKPSGRPTCRGIKKTTIETQGQRG